MADRNPFGIALSNTLLPNAAPIQMPQPSAAPKIGRGQLIAGILADALAGAMGRPGQFAQQMGEQRKQQDEEVQWQRHRKDNLADYGEQQRLQQQYAKPDVNPMLRDADTWQTMTPEQRAAYQQMKVAGAGDPDVFVTLPNGQVYAGPKSGLATALTGGGTTQRPVGRLTPINGGQTPPASGGFPRY